MAPKCNTQLPVQGRKRKPFNRGEESDLRKLIKLRKKMLKEAAVAHTDEVVEAARVESMRKDVAESLFTAEAGDIIVLNPKQRDAIGGLFASLFGENHKSLLSPNDFSVSGEVKEGLLEAGRVAQNMVLNAAKVDTVKRVSAVTDAVDELARKHGISKSDMRELVVDTIEVGQIPKQRRIYGSTPAIDLIQNSRYQSYRELAAGFGLDDGEIDHLIKLGEDISSAFDEVRMMASAVGVDIGKLKELGYFPRIATSDFAFRLRDLKVDENLLAELKTGRMPLSAVWQKSRKSWHYLPEDDVLAADILSVGVQELRELMGDPIAFRQFLDENVTASQLDTLVDAGVLNKLPMSGREVFEYLARQYELPYKHLDEMFVLDPEEALDEYARGLKDAVRNSAMLRTVTHDGLKGGWAITEAQKVANPEEFAGFVPLSSALPADLADQAAHTQAAYVHPVVARQWKALIEASSNPNTLGAAGNIWHFLTGSLNRSVLLGQNVLYVGRVFLSNVVASLAVGSNPGNWLPSFIDIIRARKGGLEFLDDTKTFAVLDGKPYTERQAFRKFLTHRNIEVAPLSGTKLEAVKFEALNPKYAPKALNYWWHYTNNFGTPWSGERITRGVEYGAALVSKGLSEAFAPIGSTTQMVELAFKWAAFKSITHKGVGNAIGNAALGRIKHVDSFRDAMRLLDDHFYMFDDPGTFGKGYSKYVQPFAGYMLKNTPAMLRFMLRNPMKFLSYHRLLQTQNLENIDPNDPPPEAGFRSTDLNKYPIILQRVEKTGEYITLMPTNYDPILDALTFVDNTGKSIQRVFGQFAGTSEEQREQVMGKDTWQSFLNGVLNQSYWSAPVEILTGYDPYTGQVRDDKPLSKKTVFLGVEMSPLMKAVLSFIPPIEMLNRSNPFGVFGYTELKDAKGNVIRDKSSPKIPGLKDRTDRDAKALDTADRLWQVKVLRNLGANVKTIDTFSNMQMSYKDISVDSKELRTSIVNAQKELTVAYSNGAITEEEYAVRKTEIEDTIDKWLQLEFDLRRVQIWMIQHKVPEKDVFNKMRDMQIVQDQLPLPGADYTRQLIQEAMELRHGRVQRK